MLDVAVLKTCTQGCFKLLEQMWTKSCHLNNFPVYILQVGFLSERLNRLDPSCGLTFLVLSPKVSLDIFSTLKAKPGSVWLCLPLCRLPWLALLRVLLCLPMHSDLCCEFTAASEGFLWTRPNILMSLTFTMRKGGWECLCSFNESNAKSHTHMHSICLVSTAQQQLRCDNSMSWKRPC